ncbi:hypothetical protein Tco_0735642 [Tanacetum coccineum]
MTVYRTMDSLEPIGNFRRSYGGAILTLVSRVKNKIKRFKQLRTTRSALGHDQPAVPSEDVEEREEEEVPLRRKRSAYRRARTEFSTLAFDISKLIILLVVLPHTAVTESAGPTVAADKGQAHMPDLGIPAEFLAEDAQARKRFKEEQASERLVQQLQAADLAQEDLQIVSEQRAKELDELMMRMTETDWLNLMMQEKKKRALADLRYRALKGKPMKQSEVTQMMRNLVKSQWCAAHNGTIIMTAIKAMTKQQLIEEYEYICRRLEKDHLLSAQYNLFRPKPAITEPPSKRQRVERASSQPDSDPAATPHTADDPDSAGGGSSNPAGSVTPMPSSAASHTAGGTFDATGIDSTVPTTAAMDSAGSRHEVGVSPFADSVDSSSPSNVPFESTSGVEDFFSSESESDDDMENYIPPLPYGAFKDWEIVYPIRATLLERMLRHRLTVPPSYCRDVVVAGNIIQTVQDGLRQAYECLASAPMGVGGGRLEAAATSFDSAVHRVHAVSFDVAVLDAAAPVSAACIIAAGHIVSAGIYDAAGSSVLAVFINICCILCFCCHSILLLREDLSRNLELTESKPIVPAGSSSSVPADYVSAGHVLVPADRDRIC